MILLFPDAPPVPSDMDFVCPEMAWSNIVALTRPTDPWSPETQGTLSIKCVFGGRETYEVEGNRMPVSRGNYLILNHGQRYSSTVDPREGAESLCIFFRPGFAEESLGSLIRPDDALLDDPARAHDKPVHFFEKLYRPNALLTPRLAAIYGTLKQGMPERGWMEEQLHALLHGMLEDHRHILAEIRRLPSIRLSTRVEVYRRLSRARDFIEGNFDARITLPDMAREAHLSVYHFLRLFRDAFGATPHQYISRLRLERAGHLLMTTDRPVAEICRALGFESSKSFSLLFRRFHGIPPTEYRRRFGGD
ncbi:MAG: AraC family transcriptional regulator [Bacteroidota bacterium]